jgi:transposase
LALVDLSVVEQRYRAVLAVQAGDRAGEVAAQLGMSRQTVQGWLARYRANGLVGLRRPESCPHQASPAVEAAVCELRRDHPRWGARRIVVELGRNGCPGPVPSRMTVYRILARRGLVLVRKRGRRREDFKRWQRQAPMELWQLDLVDGVMLADGSEGKVVTGVDDHSRFCVIAKVVRRGTRLSTSSTVRATAGLWGALPASTPSSRNSLGGFGGGLLDAMNVRIRSRRVAPAQQRLRCATAGP